MNLAFDFLPARPCTTLLVADEIALVRDGIKAAIVDLLDDAVVLEADDGESLLRAAATHPRIRLALIDPHMPNMQGGLRLAEFACRFPGIPVVVVSAWDRPELVHQVLRVPSVFAFVSKHGSTDVLRQAIAATLSGRRTTSPFPVAATAAPAQSALTPRQEQVRTLLRQGMSNKRIAGALGISEGTVKNHITDLLRVLKLRNRTQAALVDIEAR
jgi:DNA-binding NarL/FixJ family response regulator